MKSTKFRLLKMLSRIWLPEWPKKMQKSVWGFFYVSLIFI